MKEPSQSSGGSIEGTQNAVNVKNAPKNMRIRETPIRVRKGGINKVILRKNSNDESIGIQATHSMIVDSEIMNGQDENAKSDEQLMLKKEF